MNDKTECHESEKPDLGQEQCSDVGDGKKLLRNHLILFKAYSKNTYQLAAIEKQFGRPDPDKIAENQSRSFFRPA